MRTRILIGFELFMGTTDKHYIERCLDGHPDDFRHLVRSYQTPLLAYLAGCLGNSDIAEETAQEAFVRAYFSLDKLKKQDSFFSWLLGIAQPSGKGRAKKSAAQP